MQLEAATLNLYFPPFNLNTDPQTMIDARSMQIGIQIHRGLFRFLPDGDFRQDLAASWSMSDDHRKLTVRLKKAVFSNGSPIKPEHVIYSFARMFFIGASMSADLRSIKGSDQLKTENDLKRFGVSKIDDHTVKFELDRPNSLFLKQLAVMDCAILPITDAHAIFTSAKWQPDVGAGPYKLESHNANEIILSRWRPDELDSKSPPTRVSIKLVTSTNAKELIDSTKTDSLDQLVASNVERDKLKSEGWHQVVTDMTREHFLILNPERLHVDERHALALAIDNAEFAKEMGEGFETAFGYIPSVLSGALAKPPTETRKLSKNLVHKPIDVVIPGAWEHVNLIKAALSKSWAGIEIKFREVSQQDWNSLKVSKKYDVLVNARGLDYPDGISILNYFRSGVEGNLYFVNDHEVDHLLDQATGEFDESKRAELYRDIQKRVRSMDLIIPLFFGSHASGLWNKRTKFVPNHPLGYHFLPIEMIELGP